MPQVNKQQVLDQIESFVNQYGEGALSEKQRKKYRQLRSELQPSRIEMPETRAVEAQSTGVKLKPKGVPQAAETPTFIGQAVRFAEKPLVNISQYMPNPKNTPYWKSLFQAIPQTRGLAELPDEGIETSAGVIKGATKTLEGLTSPTNLALIAGTGGLSAALRPWASLIFAGHMGFGFAENFDNMKRQFTESFTKGDYGKAAEVATQAVGQLGFTFAAGKHGVKGMKEKLPSMPSMKGELIPKEGKPARMPLEIEREFAVEKPVSKKMPFEMTKAEFRKTYRKKAPPKGKEEKLQSTKQPLIQEAKKYKSAEEFVNAHIPESISWDSLTKAQQKKLYADAIKSGEVSDSFNNFSDMMSAGGVGLVKKPNGIITTFNEYIDSPHLTKSQLTDIWKKAKAQTKPKGKEDKIILEHENSIKQALDRGNYVPTKVLNEYPKLKKYLYDKVNTKEVKQDVADIKPPDVSETMKVVGEKYDVSDIGKIKAATKAIIRRRVGASEVEKTRNFEYQKEKLTFFDKFIGKNKKNYKNLITDFIDLYQHGKYETIKERYKSEKMAQFAKEYKERMEQHWEMTKEDFRGYRDNYWPGIWKNEKKAKRLISSYTRKLGKQGWTKQKYYDLWKEAIDKGLEPKSWNPEQLIQMREASTFQWLASKGIKEDLKANDLLKFFRNKREMEDYANERGLKYSMLDHPYFEAWEKTPKGWIQHGSYAAPEKAANIISKWLSPSLWARQDFWGKAFRGAMRTKNVFVPLKLALSAWHGVEVTGSAITNQMTVAAQSYNLGIKKGLYETAKIPFAPVDYAGIPLLKKGKGATINKAYKEGAKSPYEELAVDYMARANMTPEMSQRYLFDVKKQMKRAFDQRKYFKGISQMPLAGIETTMYPILEWYVPRVKSAAFFEVAKVRVKNLQRKNPGISKGEINKELSRVSDRIDDAFGQMRYDNLFWNRHIRDGLIGSSLSLGWNLGTWRMFGGASLDVGKMAKNVIEGKKPEVTQRMMYSMFYPMVFGTIGTMLGKAITGEYPHELLDMYYPKTGAKNPDGSPERIQIPTQMKEPFSLREAIRKRGPIMGPLEVAGHKLAPVWSTFYQLAMNRNYYGIRISDETSPNFQWAKDVGEFMLEAIEPIPVSARQRFQNKNIKNIAWAGFSPAPRYVTRSKTQKKIFDAVDKKFGDAIRSKEVGEQWKIKRKFREQLREGKLKQETMWKLFKSGAVEPKGFERFLEMSFMDSDIRGYSMLSSEDQAALLEQMSMDELKRYMWFSNKKTKLNFYNWKANQKR